MAYHPWGALRKLRVPTTARRMTAPAAAALALALCAGLGACASSPDWPILGKVIDLDNAMTPEQRQKALEELQKADQSQNSNASGSQTKQGQ